MGTPDLERKARRHQVSPSNGAQLPHRRKKVTLSGWRLPPMPQPPCLSLWHLQHQQRLVYRLITCEQEYVAALGEPVPPPGLS